MSSNAAITALFEADYEKFLTKIGRGSNDFDDWLRGSSNKHRYSQARKIFYGVDRTIVHWKISDIPPADLDSGNMLARAFYKSPRNKQLELPRFVDHDILDPVYEVKAFFQHVAKHMTQGRCVPYWASGLDLKKLTLTEILDRKQKFDRWHHDNKDEPAFEKLATVTGFEIFACMQRQSVVNLGEMAGICLRNFIETPNDHERYDGLLIYEKAFLTGGIQFLTMAEKPEKPLAVWCIWEGRYLLEIAGCRNSPPDELPADVRQALGAYFCSKGILPANEHTIADLVRTIPEAKDNIVSGRRGLIFRPKNSEYVSRSLVEGHRVLARMIACEQN